MATSFKRLAHAMTKRHIGVLASINQDLVRGMSEQDADWCMKHYGNIGCVAAALKLSEIEGRIFKFEKRELFKVLIGMCPGAESHAGGYVSPRNQKLMNEIFPRRLAA